MATTSLNLEQLSINTIRTLAMDAVQQANSGHPGTPMALAPVAYTVWQKFLRYDPAAPHWPNRDRFVLSCGHASMLLYSILHLAGVRQIDHDGKLTDELAVPLEHIKRFRQWDSRCPGHPEWRHTTGVETTTGPLGQGVTNSVGMAIASRWLASYFNRPGYELFDFNTYVLCSDGDLMEGVSGEAASIAGHLQLSNLCWIYDNNHITIEGNTSLAFSEEVATRFEGYGWYVLRLDDANDTEALAKALRTFNESSSKPTMIVVRSHIAWGSPKKQDTHEAHGAPLGADEIRATKEVYGWPAEAKFLVPDEVREDFRNGVGERGAKLRTAWDKLFADYAKKYPDLAREWQQMEARELPSGWDKDIPEFPADAKGTASRNSGGKVLNAIAQRVPWLLGGSADLSPSTKTNLTFAEAGSFAASTHGGRNFHFGIREHGMAGTLNGMSLCGLRPYGSTFLVFSDYCRGSMRLSAIMGLPVIYVFTHDSIGVGEDGPTHQPIEHLAALRAIPNMIVFRPGDANEVAAAYRAIMPLRDQPVSLILTRQDLPTLDRTKFASADGVKQGGYILGEAKKGSPEVILLASGSELSVAVAAWEKLNADGVAARVVSMPSFELFEAQDHAYREKVLPSNVRARVAVEAAIKQGWERYLGDGGRFVGLNHFGASAPAEELFQKFGITAERVVEEARAALRGN
ncbi:MAG: transketolase [Pirellulales bacterium]|nr:transketolase [Pirellulales bacterium]